MFVSCARLLAKQVARATLRTMSAKRHETNRFSSFQNNAEKRLKAALRLYYSARALKAAALRDRHPDWREEEVNARVREAFLYARS